MSIVHVIVLFVGGPLAIIAFCYLLAYLMSRDTSSAKTYKMGEKWDRPALWFVGQPSGTTAHRPHTVETGNVQVPPATMVGGASGTW